MDRKRRRPQRPRLTSLRSWRRLRTLSVLALDKLGIDDPVGAVSVHGVCGLLGMLSVGLFAQESYAPDDTTGDGLFFGRGAGLLVDQATGAAADLG